MDLFFRVDEPNSHHIHMAKVSSELLKTYKTILTNEFKTLPSC